MHCIPVKNIFYGENSSAALLAVVRQAVAERSDNTAIVYCTLGMEQQVFARHVGFYAMPKDVYAVIHPDNLYNVLENIRGRARTVQPTESLVPMPKIALFIDTPAMIEFKDHPGHHGKLMHIDHRHMFDAVMIADEVHVTSKMVPFVTCNK